MAIVALLAILVFSYRQVIDAYPHGGGAYAVSRANLGARASLLAAAALIIDYTLTVSVSIAAGVGALTSAFPRLAPDTVVLCLLILAVVTLLNLRGLGEAARAFLLPTAVFIVGLLAIIAIGLIHPLALNQPQPVHSLLPAHPLETVSVPLVLKAFSAGCSALTGVEAIANGVPLFKQPRVKRAKLTEMLLGVLLAVMLLGLAALARRWHIGPRSGQTVLSQIMATAVGRHWGRARGSGWQARAAVNGLGALVTGVATVIFLISKFTEGAWVVVVAIPLFILLFTRIHAYYRRVGRILRLHQIPPRPAGRHTKVIVPVTEVSSLSSYAISEALYLGQDVVAVRVVLDEEGDQDDEQARRIEEEWRRWNPGVPLEMLRTEYSSVVDPIVTYLDDLRLRQDQQLVVLIPARLRYRFLHNQLDLVLSAALRTRPEIIVARVTMPLQTQPGGDAG